MKRKMKATNLLKKLTATALLLSLFIFGGCKEKNEEPSSVTKTPTLEATPTPPLTEPDEPLTISEKSTTPKATPTEAPISLPDGPAPSESIDPSRKQMAEAIIAACEASAPEDQICRPMFYKATDPDGDGVLYLLGSFHLVDGRAYQVHPDIMKAFEESDALALEFDTLPYLYDLTAATEMSMQLMNEGMATVDTIIGEELYEILKAMYTENGVYQFGMEYMNPYYWTSVATNMVINKAGLDGVSGYDLYFDSLASLAGKEIKSLETMEFQMGLLNGSGNELYIHELEGVLEPDYFEATVASMKELYEAWLCGDQEKLTTMILPDFGDPEFLELSESLQEAYRKQNDDMYENRNNNMTKQYIDFIESGDTTFCVVGAAHYLTDTGILNQLQEAGYQLEKAELQ